MMYSSGNIEIHFINLFRDYSYIYIIKIQSILKILINIQLHLFERKIIQYLF